MWGKRDAGSMRSGHQGTWRIKWDLALTSGQKLREKGWVGAQPTGEKERRGNSTQGVHKIITPKRWPQVGELRDYQGKKKGNTALYKDGTKQWVGGFCGTGTDRQTWLTYVRAWFREGQKT